VAGSRRAAAATPGPDLAAALQRALRGAVRFDRMSRVLYSTDASNYQLEPLGVVHPRDADDVAAAVGLCAAYGVPVIPRAGGSSLAGQAIGQGVVLDVSAHLNAMELDPERRVARVQTGVVLDRLNRAAAAHGLMFGPDPASADRACLGGVVATNATGARSIRYGMAADHLLAATVVLADGQPAHLAPGDLEGLAARSRAGGREGAIYRCLQALLEHHRATIRAGCPPYWRQAGGYGLDRLVRAADHGRLDPTTLLAGSEGTLAVATSLEVALVPRPAHTALLVLPFDTPDAAFEAVPALLGTGPSAIELVDRLLVGLARQAPGFAADAALLCGDPAAWLIVEYAGDDPRALRDGLVAGAGAVAAAGRGGEPYRAVDPADQARIWRVRKAGLALLMRLPGDWKPVAGIEDTAVPPAELARYMADVRRLLADQGTRAAFYAHASAGCIHVRPILNLKTAAGVQTLAALADGMVELVQRYGGVNSSEHGDGLARGAFNRRLFGPELYGLFEVVKEAFDPQDILNPGKVVRSPPLTECLRYGPDYRAIELGARFAYPEDGDLAHAVERCNGAGVCRKLDGGAMCPSYRVTLDEEHSTRGRANALRAVLDGRLAPEELAGDRLAAVMALCVGCKACRSECPTGVDMARLKMEVMAARVAARGLPLRARLFAGLPELDRRLAPVAPLANAALGGPWAPLGARWLGLAPRRRVPPLARPTFDAWWRHRASAPPAPDAPEVVLFADTFTTYHEPEVGRATVALLEAAGFRVRLPGRRCCGRPALSQGLIDAAGANLRANVAALAPFADRQVPIVVPEPSCAAVFHDELPGLLNAPGERAAARAVAAAVRTVEELVADWPPGKPPLRPGTAEALLHVHCHQRALVGPGPAVAALRHIPGLTVRELDAGCCGMAGAFGYEAEHYALSLAMAEVRLAPAVRAAPGATAVVAAGSSCRHQIADTTGRRAVHPAELLAAHLATPAAAGRPDTIGVTHGE
jgi:FAD/FMN-containing dehydrogenase/Fe-S oxidoreductase